MGVVTVVADLSLDIPKTGIYVLLGSNGTGRSTTISILAGLLGCTWGTVMFKGRVERPLLGMIGLVPQKNVLFPELTCYQTLCVWWAIKLMSELVIDYNTNVLSGGQKHKLQLAIDLMGGSKFLLVDECTSSVDPLSCRALWRTLTSVRHDRTVVFTTHFLDEADLLADTIAVLAAPGACASLLDRIRPLAPSTYVMSSSPSEVSYHLKSKDPSTVHGVLKIFEADKEEDLLVSYSVLSTKTMLISEPGSQLFPVLSRGNAPALELTNGRRRSPLSQAFTIFHKRVLIARRSWLTPLLALLVAIAGSCAPLFFIAGRSLQSFSRFPASSV
ncbi:nucleoside triphosphate hydrolase protein [Wolfiporia cocos MD-104 SS10]|uniref:Nucleoside triphosphate hydrolase protein n=1 Tax=Wolfiporia cocos (strain MD-104) TaxID=742152 RepID=A0A2H3JE92_WOLCO|nr:nucleoside triphosphate hydrolase protein [Wolfiporia cocos MD-104 SS10]